MTQDGDVKDHAVNSSHDFYELLGITSVATASEIKRAYRQTALKYHPDKVGADAAKLEKFHLLQIAIDVLTDESARQVYDNARRAREAKKERERAYDSRRKHLVDELERRESAAGLKRKREDPEEEAFQEKLKRLAADGARRRKEREEQLRREAEEIEREQSADQDTQPPPPNQSEHRELDDLDLTVKLRYSADTPATSQINTESLASRFSRFGNVDHVILKRKKIKDEGQKHRREYVIAYILFKSIVGAHAAVTDVPILSEAEESSVEDPKFWSMLQDVNWARGKEPDCIPKPKSIGRDHEGGSIPAASFASFKGTPKGDASANSDELLMIRLKNAEQKRLLEKRRNEEQVEEITSSHPSEAPPSRTSDELSNIPFSRNVASAPKIEGKSNKLTEKLGNEEEAEREARRDAERERYVEELRRKEEAEDQAEQMDEERARAE